MSQIKQWQSVDFVNNKAMQCISNKEPITQGRLKRVQIQLRIENDILTKSGRSVVPAALRKFVVTWVHNEAHFSKHFDTTGYTPTDTPTIYLEIKVQM